VLSDLHGWMDIGVEMEGPISRIDSRKLGEIDIDHNVHERFITGGIARAVQNLHEYQVETVIGISIGGTIAWKAALEGMKCRRLICLSATRLRYESRKPDCEINLFYGSDEPFRPKNEWFSKLDLNFHEVPNMGHDFYKNHEIIRSCGL